jgi:hypothetical protein
MMPFEVGEVRRQRPRKQVTEGACGSCRGLQEKGAPARPENGVIAVALYSRHD